MDSTADELQQWIAEARDHWRRFRPELYRGLKAAGTLEQHLLKAAEQTQLEMDQLTEHGMPWNMAWEMVRQEYLFLPESPPAMTKGGAAEREREQPHFNLSPDELKKALTGQ